MFLKINQAADHGFDEPLGLLSDCHRRIERFLHALAVIAGEGRGQHLPEDRAATLRQALEYFRTAAPRHTADEEESLFPRLEASKHADAREALGLVRRLAADHRDAERRHAAVDVIGERWLRDGLLEADSVDELIEHLAALEEMYREHIAVEDKQLFPAAARILERKELEGMGKEMAERRGVVPVPRP